jgi:hypothetical protein
MKICAKCKKDQENDQYRYGHNACKQCERDYEKERIKDPIIRARKNKQCKEWNKSHPGYYSEWDHKNGRCKPMTENKMGSQYLGVCVTEELLSKYFKNVKHLSYNNPGYDFICENEFKIDAKSSVIRKDTKFGTYRFQIRKNTIADYFVCIGFDNRIDLNPLHIWIIPGKDINMLTGIAISNNERGLKKWSLYEKPLDKIVMCCSEMKIND